jgi:TolA-binding protein
VKTKTPDIQIPSQEARRILALAAVFGSSAMLLAGCSKSDVDPAPISTPETRNVQEEVKDYQRSGTEQQKNRVEQAFDELDQEIRELEIRVEKTSGGQRAEAQRKMEDLKAQRDNLRSDFTEAKFQALIKDIRESVW